ncbi:MAG: YecR family lipoprotein [Mariprofundaceae bacterium]|nr:YecR family lipoprotein [Mariprofundaceae bacterium]
MSFKLRLSQVNGANNANNAKNSLLTFGYQLITVSGCATPKQFSATGGSKADGIVKLSYEYSLFEDPQVDMAQGVTVAKKRCEAWGYAQAEAFGGSTKKCIHTTVVRVAILGW